MNIIQVRRKDIHSADLAFAEFMGKTESNLNEKTKNDHLLFKDLCLCSMAPPC